MTGKEIGTVISVMEMGSMNALMMRITIRMLAMMTHGDTGNSVANIERPMAAPEWAGIWLKAVALVTMSRANPETSTVPSRANRRYRPNYVIFSMNFAGLAQKSILDSMATMAEEVLPKFAAAG